MLHYNIAGIPIEIIPNDIKTIDKFNSFTSIDKKNSSLKITFKSCNYISPPEGKLLMNEGFYWTLNSHDGHISVHTYNKVADKIISMLKVDEAWKDASISFLENTSDTGDSLSGGLGEILFLNRILFHNGIVIHGSAVEWQGKGIIFSAPSQIGKSTQARLWKKHMGARILNGDRPAVRMIKGIPLVYGTPWCGSSCESINSHAPLSAIVILEQATQNSIRCLSNIEAVSKLAPRAFLPYHSDNLMKLAIDNLEKIITSTPVYLLKCKPDIEAVDLVYQYVK